MIETLFSNIQQHLSMLDLALQSSEAIRNHAKNENIDNIELETENRERLVNNMEKIQREIEAQINLLDAGDISPEGIIILKSWFQDLNKWTDKMLICDQETVELLSQQKENTTKEIAHVFKNKEIFKGYNNQLGKK